MRLTGRLSLLPVDELSAGGSVSTSLAAILRHGNSIYCPRPAAEPRWQSSNSYRTSLMAPLDTPAPAAGAPFPAVWLLELRSPSSKLKDTRDGQTVPLLQSLDLSPRRLCL